MATITAQTQVERARIIIQDDTGVRWPDSELLGWLNDGQREIVVLKPDSSVNNENLQLVEGTKQEIPAAGISLVDVIRNMGTDGSSPGKSVRLINRKVLDEQLPDWHSATPNAVADHFAFDDRDPKHFYVYPPQPSVNQGYVEIVYSSSPADAALGDVISVDDVYANALVDYMLYRAYSKDKDYAGNGGRASAHYQAFLRALGLKEQAERATEPVGGIGSREVRRAQAAQTQE